VTQTRFAFQWIFLLLAPAVIAGCTDLTVEVDAFDPNYKDTTPFLAVRVAALRDDAEKTLMSGSISRLSDAAATRYAGDVFTAVTGQMRLKIADKDRKRFTGDLAATFRKLIEPRARLAEAALTHAVQLADTARKLPADTDDDVRHKAYVQAQGAFLAAGPLVRAVPQLSEPNVRTALGDTELFTAFQLGEAASTVPAMADHRAVVLADTATTQPAGGAAAAATSAAATSAPATSAPAGPITPPVPANAGVGSATTHPQPDPSPAKVAVESAKSAAVSAVNAAQVSGVSQSFTDIAPNNLKDDPNASLIVSAPENSWHGIYDRSFGSGTIGNTDIALVMQDTGAFTIKGVRNDTAKITAATFQSINMMIYLAGISAGVPVGAFHSLNLPGSTTDTGGQTADPMQAAQAQTATANLALRQQRAAAVADMSAILRETLPLKSTATDAASVTARTEAVARVRQVFDANAAQLKLTPGSAATTEPSAGASGS
jgi:hypothetical protein